MKRTVKQVALAAMMAALAAGAGAQGTAAQPSTTSPGATGGAAARSAGLPLERAERRFIEHAAQGGMAEVALGRLASERGGHPQVKSFGERMVTDHGKANDELKTLAGTKGVAWPAEPDRSHKRDTDRLSKLQGASFDREYMKHMVDDHEKDVKDFEKAAKDAKDPEVKAFAEKTLPVLQQHLNLARTTYEAVKTARDNPAAMGSGTGTGPGTPSRP